MKGERTSLGAFVLGTVVGAAIAIPIVLAFSQEEPIVDTAGGPPPGASQRSEEKPARTLKGEAGTETPAAPKEATARRERVDTGPRPPSSVFGVVVYGTVTTKDGAPVKEARIRFLSPEKDRDKNRHTSLEKGGYSVHGLTPGAWKVSLYGTGLKPTTIEVTILPQESQRLDLVAERSFTVQVKLVTPSGEPLTAALYKAKMHNAVDRLVAVATVAEPSGNLPMTFSRTHTAFGIGRWSGARGIARRLGRPSKLPMDVAGELEFDVAPPVFVSVVFRHLILATKQVVAGQKVVAFKISLDDLQARFTTIRLKVVDADTMTPIAKARVGVSDHQSGSGGHPTDENGSVVLKNKPPGLLELEVWAKDRARYHRNLRLDPGEHDLGTVRLPRPVKVVGQVVDSSGKPQAATVRWTCLENRTFPQPLRMNFGTTAEADGKFELWQCAPGRYLVQASAQRKSVGYVEIDTARLGDKPFKVVLQPIVKVVIDATKMSRSRFPLITVRDANSLPVYTRYLRGPFAYNASLPPGRYTYEMHDDLRLADSGAVDVAAGGKPRIVVR